MLKPNSPDRALKHPDFTSHNGMPFHKEIELYLFVPGWTSKNLHWLMFGVVTAISQFKMSIIDKTHLLK